MSMPSKAIYIFNSILINIPVLYFTGLEQIFGEFILEPQRPQIDTHNLEKEESWRNHNT